MNRDALLALLAWGAALFVAGRVIHRHDLRVRTETLNEVKASTAIRSASVQNNIAKAKNRAAKMAVIEIKEKKADGSKKNDRHNAIRRWSAAS